MLVVLRSLGLARLFAVLALLAMTGLGQHVHVAGMPAEAGIALAAMAETPEQHSGKAIAPDAQCGIRHLVRAMTHEPCQAREPAVLRVALQPPAGGLQPDLSVPEGPARRPRRVHTV